MAHGDRKTQKMRGSRTHGYGNTQKHRGAGSRGGRGMAGSKKQRWMKVSKEMPGYFGGKGFKRPQSTSTKNKIINVGLLDQKAERLVSDSKAEKKGGAYHIDLTKLGFDRLLGSGVVTKKLKITVGVCTQSAREKIEAVGGSVEETKPRQASKEDVNESGVPETDAEVPA